MPQNQQASVFFEAIVSFTSYPWPEWNSSANANAAVIVDRGDQPPALFNAGVQHSRQPLTVQFDCSTMLSRLHAPAGL